jgi:plastocyanin
MRKLIAVAAAVPVLAAVVIADASADDPPVHAAATRTIQLGDNFFKPKAVTVKKGTVLKFIWGPNNSGTAVEHNVTGVKGNTFRSTPDTRRPDKPFRKRITKTTSIVCTIHATTMKLTVKVKR